MHGASLLIVEADVELRRVLQTHAAGHGYAVTAVAAVTDASSALRDGCDAAVLDLAPGEGGVDALARIHRASPDTEIVVMSSTTSVASAVATYDHAAFAFVQKPLDLEHLFTTLARAVDHRRINLAHRRLVWDLQVLNDISDDLRRSLDPRVLLETVLRRVIKVMEGHSGSVRLLPHPASEIQHDIFIGPEGLREQWQRTPCEIPRPSDTVIATGKPAEVSDFAAMTGWPPDRLPIRSALSVPMFAGDEMIGVLSVGSGAPRRFSPEDRRLIQSVANHLAIAVQNARLHACASAGKDQWEATFDAIGDPIAVFDRQGRVMRGNAALAAYLRRPVTTLRGLSCDDIGFCGGTFPDCAVGRPLEETCGRSEVTMPDGQIFSVTTCPVEGQPEGVAVVTIAKNVTYEIRNARRLAQMSDELAATNARLVATVDRLKTTQAQLLQAEKLSAIGQLVAGVAHELNNPLTSVIGYAQLVEEELRTARVQDPPRTAADLAHDVRRIAEESERAARIVRNLLAFARRQTAARAPQDVADLAARVLSLRAYEFRLNAVEVETAFEPGLPHVLADGSQLQQALLNLVLNAEQAMRARSPRKLRVGARYDADAGAVEVYVADSGHGIADENLRRVFDPFFTTRDVGEGTGLGLSICYGIVRDHGGQIAVQSRVGEGARFSILLPAPLTASALSQVTAVVAHGDQLDRDYITAALAGWGLRVETLDQPSAALARVRRGDLDVAFVEQSAVLADVKGWAAACGRLQGQTPLILLAGTTAMTTIDETGTSADAVLAPPFELRALLAALRSVSRECV